MSWFKKLFGKSEGNGDAAQTESGEPKVDTPASQDYKILWPEPEPKVDFSKPFPVDPAKIDEALKAFSFEIIETTGENGLETWQKLRAEHAGNSTPFILGGPENLIDWADDLEDAFGLSAEDAIKASKTGRNIAEFLSARNAEHAAMHADPKMAEFLANAPPPTDYTLDDIIQDILERWDKTAPAAETDPLTSLTHGVLSGLPHERLFIALLPTPHSYESPAYLRMGGWNEMPGSDWLCAAFRDWDSRYGVTIIGGHRDYLECYVDNPPRTKKDAARLGAEQFVACEDFVLQGTDDPTLLAASLVKAGMWGFWWD